MPIRACVSVCGTTEESAVDRLGRVLAMRERAARELVAIDPPYLLPVRGPGSDPDLFLGRFIVEGSKPGAAAAAVWLSHAVLPLDERGYGHLIERTVVGARKLHRALAAADLDPFRVVLLPEPDINIVCWVMTHPDLGTLEAIDEFNERIYARMSVNATDGPPDYIITRTRFMSPMYDGAADPILERLGVAVEEWRAAGREGLVVLRSTVMDPFLAEPPPAPDHIGGFLAALRAACERAL